MNGQGKHGRNKHRAVGTTHALEEQRRGREGQLGVLPTAAVLTLSHP